VLYTNLKEFPQDACKIGEHLLAKLELELGKKLKEKSFDPSSALMPVTEVDDLGLSGNVWLLLVAVECSFVFLTSTCNMLCVAFRTLLWLQVCVVRACKTALVHIPFDISNLDLWFLWCSCECRVNNNRISIEGIICRRLKGKVKSLHI